MATQVRRIPINYAEFNRTPLVQECEQAFRLRMPEYLRREYYLGRASYAEIATDLGCSASTVGKWMRQLGLSARQVAWAAVNAGLVDIS